MDVWLTSSIEDTSHTLGDRAAEGAELGTGLNVCVFCDSDQGKCAQWECLWRRQGGAV